MAKEKKERIKIKNIKNSNLDSFFLDDVLDEVKKRKKLNKDIKSK